MVLVNIFNTNQIKWRYKFPQKKIWPIKLKPHKWPFDSPSLLPPFVSPQVTHQDFDKMYTQTFLGLLAKIKCTKPICRLCVDRPISDLII
jgi:hypothetical protein